jgi:hypothetical protein
LSGAIAPQSAPQIASHCIASGLIGSFFQNKAPADLILNVQLTQSEAAACDLHDSSPSAARGLFFRQITA